MFKLCLYSAALLSLLSFNSNAASYEAATEQVRALLIASADAVRPGDELWIGVQQRIIPHWHTYWVNPGDSGLATRIQYDVPSDSSVGEIQWPTPERISLGPVVNYGYQNEVTLLSALKVSDNAAVGSVFPIKAKVDWLVCEEACIPQHVELALELPVVGPDATLGHGNPSIEQARARLPIKIPWDMHLEKSGEGLVLRVVSSELQSAQLQDVWFYPKQWGRISHGAEQSRKLKGNTLLLQLKPGDDPLLPGNRLQGVLALTENAAEGPIVRAYEVDVSLESKAPSDAAAPLEPGFITAIFLALLGGFILNLMPCVFPVLSFKALALLNHANQSPGQMRLQAWFYTLGILFSFALLGGLLILLKAGGAQIGWGFQFQSPLFVLFVAYLMFAVGLSLSGLFSIGGSVAGVGSKLAERSGYSGSFFTGVLATIVATPCTAPLMGAAVGFALSQPPAVLLTVFFSLGFGLASPYLILSHWPYLQRRLPKPGAWMDRLKQAMAFPMYGAAAWLVWVLAQQAGVNSVLVSGGGMVAIGFAAWLYEVSRFSGVVAKRSGLCIAGLVLCVALLGGYFSIDATPASAVKPVMTAMHEKNWEPYSAARLQSLRAEGKPVFVNFTAAWCISCLVNERVALSQASVKETFKRLDIVYLKGDWTNRDTEITRALAAFGRSGVPLYLYYPPGTQQAPIVLPQILTPEIVTQTVVSAGVSLAENQF